MRERKLRSTAESLDRLRGSLIPYIYYIYKIKRKVKRKNTMRICSLSVPRLKDEWNQTVWSANNLRCGTAAAKMSQHVHGATGGIPCVRAWVCRNRLRDSNLSLCAFRLVPEIAEELACRASLDPIFMCAHSAVRSELASGC
jgi:hypothetical protein